jgi:hypothetical protein
MILEQIRVEATAKMGRGLGLAGINRKSAERGSLRLLLQSSAVLAFFWL